MDVAGWKRPWRRQRGGVTGMPSRDFPGRRRGAVPPRSHLAWLAEAGQRIGTTLDLEKTAREFADFTVPRLADAGAVDLLDAVLRGEEGERWTARPGMPVTRAMAVSCVDSLSHLEPDEVGELSVRPRDHFPVRCLLTHAPVLVSRIGHEDYARIAPTDSAAELLRSAGVRSYMAIPLIARGVLLGVADFLRTGRRAPFTQADVALAMQLASQAAVFVDNARLYSRERAHVISLQRGLLPRHVPDTPGLSVSTCYAPSDDPAGAGGDWFDVIALPGGRTALLVGDVMSHGLPAAATMGRLRSVARTLLALDIAPERVFARLDMAARDLEEDEISTCLCAIHDPVRASFTMVRAGHPPPLLLTGEGTVETPEVPAGAPLGAGMIPYDAVRLPAPPGTHLILYTNGLIKTRAGDIDEELSRLRMRVSVTDTETLDACALVDACAPAAGRFDEVVVVVAAARHHDAAGRSRVWPLPRDASAARAARDLARDQLAAWKLADLTDATELVVSELVGNALRYGNGPGELRLFRDDRLTIEVSDTGPDLPHIQQATLSEEGGRGLQLVNAVCRRWGSCRTATGKIVWAEQDIPRSTGFLPREPTEGPP